MKKIKFYQICSGLLSITIGLLLALLRGSILTTVITVLGIGFIISGLAFGVKHITKFSILKIIIGICALFFGNTYINLSMYLLGIALIILGIFQFGNIKTTVKTFRLYTVLLFLRPITTLVAGAFILFNPMNSVESLFMICGILLIIGGVWDLYRGLKFAIQAHVK